MFRGERRDVQTTLGRIGNIIGNNIYRTKKDFNHEVLIPSKKFLLAFIIIF